VEGEGKASQLTLRQSGRTITGKRLDDGEAKRLADAAARAAKRFQEQKAEAGSEAALRKLIEGLRAGKPDYDGMSAGLAAATRQQLSQMQASLQQLGALESLAFQEVGPGGADVYTAKFAKGSLEYRIWMSPDGKIESALVRPAP
jgi:hypothetical protein